MLLIVDLASHDCSGKLFEIADYFLLEEKSDQKKLFLFFTKKGRNEKTCSKKRD